MNFYLIFKSLHLIAVISWMAGLLYLPRIFVYHSEANHESQKDIFKVMERKLYKSQHLMSFLCDKQIFLVNTIVQPSKKLQQLNVGI